VRDPALTTRVPASGALDVTILAAGRGSRLGRLGIDTLKWLLDVGGATIADRQLAGIAAARRRLPGGLGAVRVVTGHASAAIGAFAAAHPEHGLSLVHNPDYAVRNNWFSVLLALRRAGDLAGRRVAVINGDLCAEPDWITRFLVAAATTDSGSLIAVDLARPLTDESMKVAVRPDDRAALQAIGKTGVASPIGEYVGMLMARGATLAQLLSALERFEDSPAAADAWYERAVAETAYDGTRWQTWATPDSRWVEIDDDHDHDSAVRLELGAAA
jgi:choline kinase